MIMNVNTRALVGLQDVFQFGQDNALEEQHRSRSNQQNSGTRHHRWHSTPHLDLGPTMLAPETRAYQRRPSVPTLIHVEHLQEDESSESSTMSEITLVTDPVLNKTKQQTVIQLTDAERNALLHDINQAQQNKLKRQAAKQNVLRKVATDRTKFFQNLNALRLQKPLEDFGEIVSEPDDDEKKSEGDSGGDDLCMETGLALWGLKEQGHQARSTVMMMSSPEATRQEPKEDDQQGVPSLSKFYAPSSVRRTEKEQYQSNEASSHDTGRDTNYIDEIIRLKLLVANQQATIDTLGSKLHNMEVANRQVQNMEDSRMSTLEADNRNLVEQLVKFQEREAGVMMQELISGLALERSRQEELETLAEEKNVLAEENAELKKELTSMQKPVCSRRQKRSLALKRSKKYDQQTLDEKNANLERENSKLKRELARLQSPVCRSQGRRESHGTVSTAALSEDDCAWTF